MRFNFRSKILCIVCLQLISIISVFTQNSTENFYVVNQIIIKGNDLTKENIIRRELTFSEPDTILGKDIEQIFRSSKENLNNTLLFNFVTIEYLNIDSVLITVFVIVEERWYIWPNPIFEFYVRNVSAFLHEKRWDRFNYGLFLSHNNFRGRNEILKLKFRKGYKEFYSIYYNKPNFDQKQVHGLTADISYFRKHESEVKTENNLITYYKDDEKFIWQTYGLNILYTYRPGHYNYHTINLQYTYIQISDSLAKLNPNYLGNGKTMQQLPVLSYEYIKDKRDSKVYPLKGYYIEASITEEGFKLFKNDNFFNLSLEMTGIYYERISKSFNYSSALKYRVSSNQNLPYHINQALGYEDFLHGLQYYVIDGPIFFLFRNNLKYELFSPHITELKFMPFKKFKKIHYAIYLNLFVDFGYVKNNYASITNSLANTLLYSAGIGFDFVTYYDIVFRIEYSFNQLGDKGFFFDL